MHFLTIACLLLLSGISYGSLNNELDDTYDFSGDSGYSSQESQPGCSPSDVSSQDTWPASYVNRHSLLTCEHIVFDLETSGVGFDAQILQITMRLMKMGQQVKEFTTYCNLEPGATISPYAQHVHGITKEELADMPYFDDVADTIIEWVQGKILVGHNARAFDGHVLKRAIERSQGTGKVIYWIKDTLGMERRDWKRENSTTGETFPSPAPKKFVAHRGRPLEEIDAEINKKRLAAAQIKQARLVRKKARAEKLARASKQPSQYVDPSMRSRFPRTCKNPVQSYKPLTEAEEKYGGRKMPSMRLKSLADRHGLSELKSAAEAIGVDLENVHPRERKLHRTPADTIFGGGIAQSQAQIGQENKENQENVNLGNSAQKTVAALPQQYAPVLSPIRPNVRRRLF